MNKAFKISLFTLLAGTLTLAGGCRHDTSKSGVSGSNLAAADAGGFSFGDQSQFFFGLATAPAHVEDQLNDTWLDFARSGRVAAWANQREPERRLDFWSNPDEEINLAAETGVTVFRLGVDWGRLVPQAGAPIDAAALKHYHEIVDKVRAKKMRVMMTLFHHSLPKWALDVGGWTKPEVRDAFISFGKSMADSFADDVDYWVIFNEPAVFALLSNVAGIWPGGKPSPMAILPLPGALKGTYFKVVDNMTASHRALYDYIHAQGKAGRRSPVVGIAQNVGHQLAASRLDIPSVSFARQAVNYNFIDAVINQLDFIGLNYYGAELVKGKGTVVDPAYEYSESGRIVDPQGMYQTFKQVHERYNEKFVNRSTKTKLPLIVTENGISDGSDILRPAYLIEHLRVIRALMDEGIPIQGYVFWTISDNWEWADGYCPKFGLVAVDRAQNLKRTKRPSFALFKAIVEQGGVSGKQANEAWQLVAEHVGKPRPFCRNADGITSEQEPYDRLIVDRDWRFIKDRPLSNAETGPFEAWEIGR